MKRLGVLLLLCCLALATPTALAEQLQVIGGQIKIQAEVRATHYVTVDTQGIIQEIDSNTDGPARIRIFLDDVALNHEEALTPEVAAQYQHIMEKIVPVVGILYRRPVTPPALQTEKSLGNNITEILTAQLRQ